MPIFKFIALAGLALLAILFGAQSLLSTGTSASPQGTVASNDSHADVGAIGGLRAMAHHGERKHVSAAAAGPFLPVETPPVSVASATSEPLPSVAPQSVATTEPQQQPTDKALFDAQARADDRVKKPAKKKIASRKPRTYAAAPFEQAPNGRPSDRRVYVQNTPRGFDFFGAIQSW